MKKTILLLISLLIFAVSYSAEEGKRSYEKATVIDVTNGNVEPEPFEKGIIEKKIRLMIKIDSGKMKDTRVIIEYPILIGDRTNMTFETEDKIILEIEELKGMVYYNIISKDRSGQMVLAVILLAVFMLLIAKREGVKALFVSVLNLSAVGIVMALLILKGYPILPVVIGFVILSSLVNIYLMCGITKKGKTAFYGTMGTVIITLLFIFIYEKTLFPNGFSIFDINEIYESFNGINVRDILTAGIIFGLLGGLINITVSIAEEVDTVHLEHLGTKKIRYSAYAMKAGRGIIHKIVNNATLALTGAVLFIMVIYMMRSSGNTFIKFVNSEFFIEEFLRYAVLCFSITLAIPVTAFFAGVIYGRARN